MAEGEGRNADIEDILSAIGGEYGADWSYGDPDVQGSLDQLARTVSDDQLWLFVKAIPNGFNRKYAYRTYGAHKNLFAVALARAKLRGATDLVTGLDTQLEMHARWADSGADPASHHWRDLPQSQDSLSWRGVAVRLFEVLFTSWSSEALTAALEGLHALVDADSSVIGEGFDRLSAEWPRYWLLHAAECWATVHAEALETVRPSLVRLLSEGSLTERLQSWIVLCRLADTVGESRPMLPLPSSDSVAVDPAFNVGPPLLHTSGIRRGLAQMSDRNSAARLKLRNLFACGWDFTSLQGAIASALLTIQPETKEEQKSAPHRYSDFFCLNLRTESAVGHAIASVLTTEVCDDASLPFLAQGYLDNDEPWLQRFPPRRASPSMLWPPANDYSASEQKGDDEVERCLRRIAVSLDVPPGWMTFAARVFFCTHKRDYVLYYWHESSPADSRLSFGPHPSCPSGRTFLWWLLPGARLKRHPQQQVALVFRRFRDLMSLPSRSG